MKAIILSEKKFLYEELDELKEEFIKRNIVIGDGVRIGDGVKIGERVRIGYGVKIGDEVEIGYGVKIGDEVEILRNTNLTKLFYATGIYKYHNYAYWKDTTPYIGLGCHLRTVDKWESEFWNNPDEFPNDDSEKSKARVFAFEICKQWFTFNAPKLR